MGVFDQRLKRLEQKNEILGSIERTDDKIDALIRHRDWLDDVFSKIIELEELIEERAEVNNWDKESLQDSLIKQSLEKELTQINEEVHAFESQLGLYDVNLLEGSRSKLKERSELLGDMLDKINEEGPYSVPGMKKKKKRWVANISPSSNMFTFLAMSFICVLIFVLYQTISWSFQILGLPT